MTNVISANQQIRFGFNYGRKESCKQSSRDCLGILVILLAMGMGEAVLYYNSQLTEIQNQKESLKTPELVNVGLGANPETQPGAISLILSGMSAMLE